MKDSQKNTKDATASDVKAIVMPITLTVAGHDKKLKCISLRSNCGEVKNGIAFAFEDEGGWVIPLYELEKIVQYAKELK